MANISGLSPKSMLAGLFLGYAAVGLALFTTVLLSHRSLSDLTHHSERLVDEGATLSSLGSQLRDSVTRLERTTRQYTVLRDEELLSLFYQCVSQVNDALTALSDAGFIETAEFSLPSMQRRLSELVMTWNASLNTSQSFDPVLTNIDKLEQQAEAVIRVGNRALQEETDSLREAAKQARQRIVISATTLFPGAMLMLWWLMNRTYRSLDSLRRAINSLGEGAQGQDIRIDGPQELQDLGKRLNWLSRRLQELNEDKERLLRHVSHELKTPLSSLKEASYLIGDEHVGQLNPQQAELREILLTSNQELQDQIEKLLEYAAWRRDHGDLEIEAFSTAAFANDLKQTFKLQLRSKELRLEIVRRCKQWKGHPSRLMEAMENLLSNAIKHAPANTKIELVIDQQGDLAVASIRDQGCGIPDDEKQSIFEPFKRGKRSYEKNIPGTGVGLSIVSECALAHQGEIFVEDAHPGSRFVMRWPMKAS